MPLGCSPPPPWLTAFLPGHPPSRFLPRSRRMAGPGALESCVTAELAGRLRLPTLLAFAAFRPLKWLTLDFVKSSAHHSGPLQSFQICHWLRRGPVPLHSSPDALSIRRCSPSRGLTGIAPGASMSGCIAFGLLSPSAQAISHFPTGFPRSASPPESLLRWTVPRTCRYVYRVCTSGLLADRVHPRWLS